jgi:hypothetical protein
MPPEHFSIILISNYSQYVWETYVTHPMFLVAFMTQLKILNIENLQLILEKKIII